MREGQTAAIGVEDSEREEECLDRTLEDNATQSNLSVQNVKSIIHVSTAMHVHVYYQEPMKKKLESRSVKLPCNE